MLRSIQLKPASLKKSFNFVAKKSPCESCGVVHIIASEKQANL